MSTKHPYILKQSSNRYQSWEVVDPEIWVPDGYAIVRVDSRGMGRSPGFVDNYSPRETKDLHTASNGRAAQPWCTGKVGLCGISYFAINAWHVAGLQPPHLAAIVAWEGAADHYRDQVYHGGIFCEGRVKWFPRAIHPIQHGVGERGSRSQVTGEWVAGPETLSEETLAASRIDALAKDLAHSFDDNYHQERSAKWDKIIVPLLSAGNWGGQANHLRGNTEGFVCAASKQKWLEIHGDTHWGEFYSNTASPAKTFSRSFPEKRGQWVGQRTARPTQNPTSEREIRTVRKEGLANAAHAMDKFFLSRNMNLSRDEPATRRAQL